MRLSAKRWGTVVVDEANHATIIDDGEAFSVGVVEPGERESEDGEGSVTQNVDDENLGELV